MSAELFVLAQDVEHKRRRIVITIFMVEEAFGQQTEIFTISSILSSINFKNANAALAPIIIC